jgi:hypothetical protein
MRDVSRMERDYYKLSEEHKQRLRFDYKEKIENMKKAVFRNFFFLTKLVQPYNYMFKFTKGVNIILN